MNQQRHKQYEKQQGRALAAVILIGLGIACLVTAAGLAVGAWLLDQNLIMGGQKQYIGMVLVITGAALLAAGWYTACHSQRSGIRNAIIAGIVYILLRAAIGLFFVEGWVPGALWWLQSGVQLAAVVLGGFLGRLIK